MSSTFRDQRLNRGWSLRDLADQCAKEGIPRPSDSNLSAIERGLVTPRPALRAVLARVLTLPEGVSYFDHEDVSA